MSFSLSAFLALLWMIAWIVSTQVQAQQQQQQQPVVQVRYGYFSEARPIHAACGLGFFNFLSPTTGVPYQVTCFPQTSGGFAASRLDSGQLQIANLGSTPMAQAVARGIDVEAIYISHYMGDSQGIYVRPSKIVTPLDLKGTTIGVPFGSTMHYQVLFVLDLLAMTGSVTLVDLSPSQIIRAWDDQTIDAGACWGIARDYILAHGGQTLLSARDMANWGRPTFVVVAVQRTFARDHFEFVSHFVAVLSRINDSFEDRLGARDDQNILRWDAQKDDDDDGGWNETTTVSFLPSLVDALMLSTEQFQNPSQKTLNEQRAVLELFRQITAETQSTCAYLGPGPGGCNPDEMLTLQTLEDTARFLLDQKDIATLGSFQDVWGYEGLNGAYLWNAQRECSDCYPVGNYGALTSGKELLNKLEEYHAKRGESPYASTEVGRAVNGDSTCKPGTKISGLVKEEEFGYISIGDGANADWGKSYSDNLNCTWEIRSPDCDDPKKDACELFVQLRPIALRLWSGDFVKIYSDPVGKACQPGSKSKVLEAQLTGFYDEVGSLPPFRAKGCLLVTFETDGNPEKWYGESPGDGFAMALERGVAGCSGPSDCNGRTCNGLTGFCDCGATSFGADCSHEDFCLGTNRIILNPSSKIVIQSSSSATFDSFKDSAWPSLEPYENDLDCTWDISVPSGEDVKVTIVYDLEETHDLLYLQQGALSFEQEPSTYTVLTGKNKQSAKGIAEVYYIPSAEYDLSADYAVSIRLVTDSRGRRRGFHATLETVAKTDLQEDTALCSVPGQSGSKCEVDHCIETNRFQKSVQSSEVSGPYLLGRVVSQTEDLHVWPSGKCVWPIPDRSQEISHEIVAVRFVFNSPLDLEPKFVSNYGDQLQLETDEGVSRSFFIEKCQTDEDCNFSWQTGQCDNGGCLVQEAVEAPVRGTSGSSIRFVTDRNDGGRNYQRLDFDALLVKQCPTKAGLEHCENPGSKGVCQTGLCMCPDNIPCSCPCAGEPKLSASINVGRAAGIVLPLFFMMIGGFLVYRHRKILASRKHKQIIAEKEAELEAFRDSIVGICVAVREYVPQAVATQEFKRALSKTKKLRVSYSKDGEQGVWCWQETSQMVSNHDPVSVFGDPKDCWIKYDKKSNDLLEQAHKGGSTQCHPLDGYAVDFSTMLQTKEATGFQRKVQRIVPAKPAEQIKDLDLSEAHFSDGLPAELAGEPQVVLIKDDLIQISKKRDDGWCFGTKMFHADEAAARELVKLACKDAPSTDDANILVDTGWFQVEATAVPTKDQLLTLQRKVGGANALDPPEYWKQVDDAVVAECIPLQIDSSEAAAVINSFLSTLRPKQKNVAVESISRIQNLAMWQSYVVKRQTICYRELESNHLDPLVEAQTRAQQRAERRWLWHGTNAEVMKKIMQQGFNRSFCGKNATMYGKGVYFARDASYSACRTYAVPDMNGYQYVMACRVVVGEYCKGVQDALIPPVRDAKANMLYDSTVDNDHDPTIYVTYHDAQAYPEYLIKFRLD